MITCDVPNCAHKFAREVSFLDGRPVHLCMHHEYEWLDMLRGMLHPLLGGEEDGEEDGEDENEGEKKCIPAYGDAEYEP